MDALLLIASTDRPVRFLMFKDIYEQAWMKPFARILGVIPISSEQRPRELLHSLQTASDAIRNGEVVCIFAEGQITRIGQLLPFRRGLERIMKDVDAPIVPVALDGVLGSPSSFEHGRFVWKLPARLPHPVTVSFGAPLPRERDARLQLRQAVQELLADAWPYRRDRMQPLPRALRADGAAASAPVCHGRREQRKSHVRRGAGENGFSRATVEKNLGRTPSRCAPTGSQDSSPRQSRRQGGKWSAFSCRRPCRARW